MKVPVCRLCGVAHRSSEPHQFTDAGKATIEASDSVRQRPNRAALMPKRQQSEPVRSIEPMGDYVTRAEFEAFKRDVLASLASLSASRVTVEASRVTESVTVPLRSNVTADGSASDPSVSHAERQRRYRQRQKEATK